MEMHLDLHSYLKEGSSKQTQTPVFPNYSDFNFIEYEIIDSLLDSVDSFIDQQETQSLLIGILGLLASDITRILVRYVEIYTAINILNVKPVYNFAANPIADYLAGNNVDISFGGKSFAYIESNQAVAIYHYIRRQLSYRKRVLTRKNNHIDTMSSNLLCMEYLATENLTGSEIFPYYLITEDITVLHEDAESISNVITGNIISSLPEVYERDNSITQRLINLVAFTVKWHVAQARLKNDMLNKQNNKWFIHDLYGGTPKLHGLLIGRKFQSNGAMVRRFSHGGERGLFVDYFWGLTELPYCDEYYLHGRGEVDLMTSRYKKGRMATYGKKNIAFKAIGSERHLNILRNSDSVKGNNKRYRTILFLTSPYVGEELLSPPSFRPQDCLLFEWHCWILKVLKKLCSRLVLKGHPKGLQGGMSANSLLSGYCDHVLNRHFDINALDDIDCIVFEFAGSAFMDAMSSNKGIVYIDMGMRKIDKAGLVLLEDRVERVQTYFDDSSRIRLDKELLSDAVNKACEQGQMDKARAFTQHYFSV